MKNKKKTIIFIEASNTGAGEVTAKYAKDIGLTTVLMSFDPKSYTESVLRYIDYPIECDIDNLNALLIHVKSLDFEINGVTTTNDLFVPHASYIAEKLHLASMKYKDVLNVRNKFNMRIKLREKNNSLNPNFEIACNYDDALKISKNLNFPVIFKPQDLNDSLYVNLINDKNDVVEYFKQIESWNRKDEEGNLIKPILIEEFIQGEEFSIETFQFYEEEINLIGITKKIMTGIEHNSFVELGVTFPHDELNEKIFPIISKALVDIGINCGVIHTEFRISDGEIKILEINPRLMGDMAGSHLLDISLGDNPAHLVVDIAMNNKKIFKPLYRKKCTLLGVCLPQSGYFYGIANEAEILGKGAVKLGAIKPLGKKYNSPPLSNIDVVARIITKDKTIEKSIKKANEIVSLVKFKKEY